MKINHGFYRRRLSVLAVLVTLLAGCFGDNSAAEFKGSYANQTNADKLVFANETVEIQSNGQALIAPFTIDNDMVIIDVRRNSKEKRPNIVMRIHGGGELLTCSDCALYNLSNVWSRVESK
jgi:spermidine/putrescine-binding protein